MNAHLLVSPCFPALSFITYLTSPSAGLFFLLHSILFVLLLPGDSDGENNTPCFVSAMDDAINANLFFYIKKQTNKKAQWQHDKANESKTWGDPI